MRKIGVEEELMLVNPDTGELAAVSSKALRAHEELAQEEGSDHDEDLVDQEAFLQQIETATKPCTGLGELGAEIVRGRRAAGRAAREAGAAAVLLVLVRALAVVRRRVWQRLDRPENADGAIRQAQITLGQMPGTADFATTTPFSRDEWQVLLNNMKSN